MDFREAISGELPAPRDDEPAGLRQDILDEQADHLACSFNRELLRGAQSEEARRRAIERFGSPAAVARRLWLDAMRGKIMAQRLWIATSLIVTAACVGLTGLAWSQSRRVAFEQAEANRRLAEALSQSRSANEAILRRLEAIAKASSRSSEWVPIKLRLALEKPDCPPAVGYEVHLGRGIGGASGPSQMIRTTDDSGLADFGVVQPGDWEFQVQAYPWTLTQSVNVLPDTPVDRTIACPVQGQAPVKVRVDWPKSLVDRDLVAIANFRHLGVKLGPFAWDSAFEGPTQILCRSRDGAMGLGGMDLMPYEFSLPLPKAADLVAEGRVFGFVASGSLKPGNEPLTFAAGHYEMDRLMLFRPIKIPGQENSPYAREKDALGLLRVMDRSGLEQSLMNKLNMSIGFSLQGGGPFIIRADRFPPDYLGKIDRLDVRPGQPTEWVIPIPDEMARTAGERAEKFVRLLEERARSRPESAPALPGTR